MMDELAALLRVSDLDRYLSTLYAPEARRGALTALYAFNLEIASVRDRIHEPLPGEVRLQWWRDVIAAGTEEAAAGHPLAMAIVRVIRDYQLPVAAFENMLEARTFDLYDDPMPTTGDLEGYLGETASALIQLACLVLDPAAAVSMGELSGYSGCAQGIAGLLRLVPLHRARGQCYVPQNILSAAGTTRDAFVSGSDRRGAERAMAAMIALGRARWGAFRAQASRLPETVRPAFVSAALAPTYLKACERAGCGALDGVADVAPWRRQWIEFRAASGRWP